MQSNTCCIRCTDRQRELELFAELAGWTIVSDYGEAGLVLTNDLNVAGQAVADGRKALCIGNLMSCPVAGGMSQVNVNLVGHAFSFFGYSESSAAPTAA